jgi:hypothetical protein
LTDDVDDAYEMAMFEWNVRENIAETKESPMWTSELVGCSGRGHGSRLVQKEEGVDGPPLSPLVSDGTIRYPFACFKIRNKLGESSDAHRFFIFRLYGLNFCCGCAAEKKHLWAFKKEHMEQIDRLVHKTRNILLKMKNGVRSTFAAVGDVAPTKVFVQTPPKFVVGPPRPPVAASAPVPVSAPQQPPQSPQMPMRRSNDISYEQAILSGRNMPVLSPSRVRQAQGILPIVQALVGVSPNSFDPSVTLDPPIPGVVSTGSLNANIPIAVAGGGVSSFGNVQSDGGAPKSRIPAELVDLFGNTGGYGDLKGRGM